MNTMQGHLIRNPLLFFYPSRQREGYFFRIAFTGSGGIWRRLHFFVALEALQRVAGYQDISVGFLDDGFCGENFEALGYGLP